MKESLKLIVLLYQRRKYIIGSAMVAALCAAIFSSPYFIAPIYKSEVILYPSGTNSNKVLIEKDPHFGADKEIDEQIQILKSDVIRDSIIKKYSLYKHYNIDTTQKNKDYKLHKKYDKNILIDRTRYNSIAVTVYDTDPQLAAIMANDVVKISDHVKQNIIQKNLHAALQYLEKDYNNKLKEFDELAEKINRLIKDNLIKDMNIKKQSFVERMKQEIDIRREMAKSVNTKSDYNLKEQYNYESILGQLVELQFNYEQASSNLNNNIPTCYIISPASVSFQKTYPIRWLIVLIATGSTFLIVCTFVIISEKLNQLWTAIKQDATL